MSRPRGRLLLTAAAAVGGLVLFVYSIREAGVRQITDSIVRVGWGLFPILGLAGLRFVLRAEAWRLCTPAASRLTLREAFRAFLGGDALGNLTPLGLIASEPTKVLLTRHRLATRESVASLALDNLVYSLSVVVMIAAGLVVMLATVPLSFAMREWSVAGLVALAFVCVGGVRMLRKRHAPVRAEGAGWRERVNRVRQAVNEAAAHPDRLWRAFALDVLFHVVAVLEVFVTLRWLLGDRSPTLTEAVMFESLNRVITAVFKFIPLRVGVDEAASGAFASLVGFNSAAGVALAVVRKVRSLFWMAVGLVLIAIVRAQGAPATGPRESVPAPRT